MRQPPADLEPRPSLGPDALGRPTSSDHSTAKRVLVASGVVLLGGVLGFLLTAVPPLLLFGVCLGLVGAMTIFAYPYVGLVIYAVLYILRPAEMYPVLVALRPERMVAILTLGALVFSMIRRERKIMVDGSRQTALFAAFLGVCYLTLMGSYWPGQTASRVVELAKIFAFYIMIIHLIDTRMKFKVFLFTFLGMIGYLAVSSVRAYYAGDLMFAQGIQRAIGTTSAGGDPNALGGSLGSALGLFVFLATAVRGFWKKALVAALAAACLWTIALTGSRGTMLGLLSAGFFIWLLSSRKFLIGFLSISVLVGAFIMLPDSYKERYSTVTSGEIDASTQQRFVTWRHGLMMVIDRPLLGVGLGCFSVAHAKDYSPNRNYLESHSLYVQVPAETGILGTFVFFTFLAVAIRENRRLVARLREKRSDWGFEIAALEGLFVGLMFLLVFSVFGHSLMRYTWYVFAAMGVALQRLHVDLPGSSPEPGWAPEASSREEGTDPASYEEDWVDPEEEKTSK